MSDSGTWIEIVLLAMLAGFIGLRLVNVLGKRTGDEKAVGDAFRPAGTAATAPAMNRAEVPVRRIVDIPAGTRADLAPALQAVADADPSFDPEKFLAGAQSAYRLILEAFWVGDAAAMEGLVSDEVLVHFETAIADRGGTKFDNSLARINSAAIVDAKMHGQMAEVSVHFDAAIAAGQDAAVSGTYDLWTFSRHVGTYDPAWLLIATDAHE